MKPVAPVTKYAIGQSLPAIGSHGPLSAAVASARALGARARARRVPRRRRSARRRGRRLRTPRVPPRLQRERLGERHAEALDRRAAVGEHRPLREAREPLGELERALEVARPRATTSVSIPIASASCASMMRPVRIRSSARPEADDARQPLRAAVDQRHAPAALGVAERASPRWRSAGRTTARARGRPRGRSPRSRRSSAWRAVRRVKPIGPSALISRGANVLGRLQVGAGAEGRRRRRR